MRHPVDRLGGAIVALGPRRRRVFAEGWGEERVLARPPLPSGPPDPVTVAWDPPLPGTDPPLTCGRFPDPDPDLPAASREATVLRVSPRRDTGRSLVLMAAWNEHDPRRRLAIARRLAARGIESWILENPYYGARRPTPASVQPIRTVADFVVMGSAALREGRALLATLHARDRTVGVAGYSMGGNLAALVSATTPFPVATAPLAASHSPAPVFLDGVLRGGIAWDALGGEVAAAPRLRRLLAGASVLAVPAPRHAPAAVLVAARHDAYIPREATLALHEHWDGSSLRWTGGGHATLLWYRTGVLVATILDAFARLSRLR